MSGGLATKGGLELRCQFVPQFAHFVGVKGPAQKLTAFDQPGEVTEETAEQTGRVRLVGANDAHQLGAALRTEDRGNAHRGDPCQARSRFHRGRCDRLSTAPQGRSATAMQCAASLFHATAAGYGRTALEQPMMRRSMVAVTEAGGGR